MRVIQALGIGREKEDKKEREEKEEGLRRNWKRGSHYGWLIIDKKVG